MRRMLVLLLVALAACSDPSGSSTGADRQPATTSGEETDAAADWSIAHALATAPPCGIDEVLHRLQGQPERPPGSSTVACPRSPSQLDPAFGVSHSMLFYFDLSMEHIEDVARRGYPGFVLEGWMDDVGPEGSPRLECVYVGCTRLQVAAEGIPTTGPESCLGPLTGGTSLPSAGEASCPAAVRIAGAFRPYVRTRPAGAVAKGEPAACCYPVPPPVAP